MSNLVPQVRVNKNGVPVTRHVKPDSGMERTKNIPMPSALPAMPSPEEDVTPEELELLINERGIYAGITKGGVARLAEHSPETRRRLKAMIQEWPDSRIDEINGIIGFNIKYHNAVMVVAAVANDVRKMSPPDDEFNDAILQVVQLCDRLKITTMDTEPNEFHFSLVKAHALGSRIYLDNPFRALIPHEQYMFVEQIRTNLDVLEPAAQVISVVSSLAEEAEAGPSFEEMMEIAEFVGEYPGRSDEITRIISQRGAYDPEIIREIMSSDSLAVSSGML